MSQTFRDTTLVPPVAVRLRRDFGAVLNLIRAHALLHQASRDRDGEGRIVASIADYAAVHELVADLVSEGVGATVSPVMRETVASVHRLVRENKGAAVGAGPVAKDLDIDRSAATRRLRSAIDKGFVKNLEDKRGKLGKYVEGEQLPDDVEILPHPMQVCSDERGDTAPSPP